MNVLSLNNALNVNVQIQILITRLTKYIKMRYTNFEIILYSRFVE